MGERIRISPVGTKSKRTAKRISYDRLKSVESLLIFEEQKKKTEECYKKYGTHKYIWKGTLDRIKGIEFNTVGLNEGDAISYSYGYYERGTKLIDISITQGFIKYEYTENEEKKIYSVLPENFEEALTNIAMNDGMNSDIKRENLTDIMKSNEVYNVGYIIGIGKLSGIAKIKKRG